MSYLIGYATDEEIKELERRGWEIESPPKSFVDEEEMETTSTSYKPIMVWVDSDLFDIMDGPDWSHGEEEEQCKLGGPGCLGSLTKSISYQYEDGYICEVCWDNINKNGMS